jgi:hypothetical protein
MSSLALIVELWPIHCSPAWRGWPELAEQRRAFEVVVTVPREGDEEPLVPCALPPEVLGYWSADKVIMSAMVRALGHSGAVAAAEALVPELARAGLWSRSGLPSLPSP